MRGFLTLKLLLKLFSSYALACVVLILLLILTFVGTLEQVDHGIYDVQHKYFNSIFLVHHFFGKIPIPMPGGGVLLVILFLNLVCGGIVRIRKYWSNIGILIVHLGMGFMLISAFVTHFFMADGHMTLYEGERSDVFVSYFDWEFVIMEPLSDGETKEYMVPVSQVAAEGGVEIFKDDLPLDIHVSNFQRNSSVLPKGPMFDVNVPVIDGYFLNALPPTKEAEQNAPGAYISLVSKRTPERHEGLIWGGQRYPWTVEIEGRQWSFHFRKKQSKVPFTIVLDKFTRELHPGTSIPKVFMSDVTKIEDGVGRSINISMNEPLRHKGFTFFQSGWGPANARPGDTLFSTFAVVKNPADKYPLYACIVIGTGLFIHFAQKLIRYIQFQDRSAS